VLVVFGDVFNDEIGAHVCCARQIPYLKISKLSG
jgi:hypothetical protein